MDANHPSSKGLFLLGVGVGAAEMMVHVRANDLVTL